MNEKIVNFLKSNTGLGIAIGISILGASFLLSNTLKTIKSPRIISVKGSAGIPIMSDIGTMSITLNVEDKNLVEGIKKLSEHTDILLKFLGQKNFSSNEIEIVSTETYPVYKKIYLNEGNYTSQRDTDEINFHRLIRRLQINSKALEKLKELETTLFSLLEKGLNLQVRSPEFQVSNLEEVKLLVLEKAIENAKKRAILFANTNHNTSLIFKSASQGIFQITPPHDTGISDYGRDDKTTINKLARSVVTINYEIT